MCRNSVHIIVEKVGRKNKNYVIKYGGREDMLICIVCLFAIGAIIEAVLLHSFVTKCKKQQVKIRLLEEIIEERFLEHGKSIDRSK